MGVIHFIPSDEMLKPSVGPDIFFTIFNKIYTTNWRAIAETEDGNNLMVVAHNYRLFKIEDITLKEFYDNNKNKGTIKKTFYYDSCKLSCLTCNGNGRVDWIQKVMNQDTKHIPPNLKRYIRDPNHITIFDNTSDYENMKSLYGSIPHLHIGHEICPQCRGTGLRL